MNLAIVQSVRRRLPRRKQFTRSGAFGMLVITMFVLLAATGPSFTGDPRATNLSARLQSPSFSHVLGTDELGRDLLARVVAGARWSLVIAATATAIGGAIGVLLGAIAGASTSVGDRTIGFLADVQLAIPVILIAIALTATIGAGIGTVIATLALSAWVSYARVVRLQTRSLLNAPFVEGARAAGAGPVRVLARHVAPGIAAPVVVIASQHLAAMILFEAALSFLGLGVPVATITWGRLIADGRDVLATAWWVSVVPGVVLALFVLGCTLLGDWQRDLFDPRRSLPHRQISVG